MSEEDSFRDAMADVAPLPQKRVAHAPTPPVASPAQLERREAALGERKPRVDPNYLTLGEVPLLHPREILEWKKDGVQHAVFRRLKAGHYAIEGELDLHRHTVREARVALFEFLNRALGRGWRTVLVSHGRGERSPTPGRIKSYVAHWLTQVPEVIAFHSAIARQGGTGSVYVMLKKSPEARDAARERHGGKREPSGLNDSETR
ncbi:MAG: DNA endonuclease SmrA [Pseudomonadales bacterium]|nr:DNA endonuclease SmrA [Pseudomonadales bacterium]